MAQGYNHLNRLLMYKNVISIVKQHYRQGMSYAYIYREYVNGLYPMTYQTFLKIINTPNIDGQIKDELDRIGKSLEENPNVPENQLKLFDDENNT